MLNYQAEHFIRAIFPKLPASAAWTRYLGEKMSRDSRGSQGKRIYHQFHSPFGSNKWVAKAAQNPSAIWRRVWIVSRTNLQNQVAQPEGTSKRQPLQHPNHCTSQASWRLSQSKWMNALRWRSKCPKPSCMSWTTDEWIRLLPYLVIFWTTTMYNLTFPLCYLKTAGWLWLLAATLATCRTGPLAKQTTSSWRVGCKCLVDQRSMGCKVLHKAHPTEVSHAIAESLAVSVSNVVANSSRISLGTRQIPDRTASPDLESDPSKPTPQVIFSYTDL